MKKINDNKIFAIILVIFFVSMLTFSAYAEEDLYRYSHFLNINANLSINGGLASSSGSATPKPSTETRKVTILVVLQKYDDGVWRIVKSWSATAYNTSALAGGTWSVPSGYQYRTYVSAKVYDGDGHLLEHVTKTSGIVYY